MQYYFLPKPLSDYVHQDKHLHLRIYQIVEQYSNLDAEDFEPQFLTSDIPKWKRNVRNVLQYRKKTGEIRWDKDARCLLP